jgi:hypothetical protein
MLIAIACGGTDPGAHRQVDSNSRTLRFPEDCAQSDLAVFGFEITLTGARATDVSGIVPDWVLTVGPEAGSSQQLSGHCLHGVSAAREASSLPAFCIRSTGSGAPRIECRLVLTRDFDSFDTVGCRMLAVPAPLGPGSGAASSRAR